MALAEVEKVSRLVLYIHTYLQKLSKHLKAVRRRRAFDTAPTMQHLAMHASHI